jgi:hypothetical protein
LLASLWYPREEQLPMDVANKFQRFAIFDQPASSYSFPETIYGVKI